MNADLMERFQHVVRNKAFTPRKLVSLYDVTDRCVKDTETLLGFMASSIVRRMVLRVRPMIKDVQAAGEVVDGTIYFKDESDEEHQYVAVEIEGSEETLMRIARRLASLGTGVSVHESTHSLFVVWDSN